MTALFLPTFISELNALRLYSALSWVNCVAGGCKEFLIPLQKQKETAVLWKKKKKKKKRKKKKKERKKERKKSKGRQGHNLGFMGE